MSTIITRQVGVGHLHALHLKDVYRDKIIPLIDKSYGTSTGFSLFKDVVNGEHVDQEFFDLDVIPVYDNYSNPSSWIIDDTTKWWVNLDNFCKQASNYNITVIPTLFDFCCSQYDPFITKLSYPYTTFNWDNSVQGEYVKVVVDHIKNSGANYILNLGSKYYTSSPVLPDFGWFRKLVMFLIDTCNVPSNNLSLTYGPDINLYNKNPYCRYKTWTGDHIPTSDEINIEEYVDSKYGGIGSESSYIKYLTDNISEDSIQCMSTWKMIDFINNVPIGMSLDHPNVMNYIFAPNQRQAMRTVLGNPDTNNGFIDFT